MPEWSPEIVVDEPHAPRLIGERFPELDGAAIEPLGEGWDSTVWLVDERWVFRFPRREVVVPGFLRETRVLSRLAPCCRCRSRWQSSGPSRAGSFPGHGRGSATCRAARRPRRRPPDEARAGHGAALGRFLRALHDADPGTVTARRSGASGRSGAPRRHAAPGGRHPPPLPGPAQRRPVDGAPRPGSDARIAPSGWIRRRRWPLVHGDLHVRHLLIGADGEPSGVIDWIDVCRAHPAIDLPLYWGYLPPAGRARLP